MVHHLIKLPVLSCGPSVELKSILLRVAREDDETVRANLTIARRLEGGTLLAGLRLTFKDQVNFAQSWTLPDMQEPFTTLTASDSRPETVQLGADATNLLVGAPALAVIGGLQTILVNMHSKNKLGG
jgi:hypothetical protein